MTLEDFFNNMNEQEIENFHNRVTERILAEQEEHKIKVLEYTGSEDYGSKLQNVIEYLKENESFVFDGYRDNDWSFPIAFEETDIFISSLLYNKEGVEDESAIFFTTVYYFDEFIIEEVSGQGTMHILKIKE